MSLILGEKNKKKYSGQSKFLPGKRKGISLLKVEVMAKYNYAAHNLKLSAADNCSTQKKQYVTRSPWHAQICHGAFILCKPCCICPAILAFLPTGCTAFPQHCLQTAAMISVMQTCHKKAVCAVLLTPPPSARPAPGSTTAWEQGERTLNGMNEFFWEPNGAVDVPVHCRGVGPHSLKGHLQLRWFLNFWFCEFHSMQFQSCTFCNVWFSVWLS